MKLNAIILGGKISHGALPSGAESRYSAPKIPERLTLTDSTEGDHANSDRRGEAVRPELGLGKHGDIVDGAKVKLVDKANVTVLNTTLM